MNDLKQGRHAVYSIKYHLVWIPKHRNPVLINDFAKRLREIFSSVADDRGWTILELAFQPDDICLFFEATTREAPYQIAHTFKGRSSRLLRQEFPHLLKLPSLWTRAYFRATVGHVSSETIERYIQGQSNAD